MHEHDVSVIVPTRNRRDLLACALASVAAQQHAVREIVVIDDGSSDGTAEMLAGIQNARVSVIRHDTPAGVSASRNDGIARARGRWIAFLDDDDLWSPAKLALQIRAGIDADRHWIYAGHVNVDLRNVVTGGAPPASPDEVLRQLPTMNAVPGGCSGVVVAARLLERTGGFDPRLQPLADWDLWLRLAERSAPASVARPLVGYRIHGRQMSRGIATMEQDLAVLRQRHPGADPRVLFRHLGWRALRTAHHREALRLFARARGGRDGTTALARDVAALCRSVLRTRLPRGLGGHLVVEPRHPEHRPWLEEGQAWIDALAVPPGWADAPARRPLEAL